MTDDFDYYLTASRESNTIVFGKLASWCFCQLSWAIKPVGVL